MPAPLPASASRACQWQDRDTKRPGFWHLRLFVQGATWQCPAERRKPRAAIMMSAPATSTLARGTLTWNSGSWQPEPDSTSCPGSIVATWHAVLRPHVPVLSGAACPTRQSRLQLAVGCPPCLTWQKLACSPSCSSTRTRELEHLHKDLHAQLSVIRDHDSRKYAAQLQTSAIVSREHTTSTHTSVVRYW